MRPETEGETAVREDGESLQNHRDRQLPNKEPGTTGSGKALVRERIKGPGGSRNVFVSGMWVTTGSGRDPG